MKSELPCRLKKISSGYEAKTGFKAEKTVQGLK